MSARMAAPRLPFLWPALFKPIQASQTTHRIALRKARLFRSFVASARRGDAPSIKRYGTAQEPAAHLREHDIKEGEKEDTAASSKKEHEKPVEEDDENHEEEVRPTPSPAGSAKSDAVDSTPASPPPDPPRVPESKPLDTVLHMPSPSEEDERKAPHLKTPPYVHHFDTYSLVKQLVNGGISNKQSVTIMKAVRGILAENIELARAGLVSKSNVENETYLFRAACSELRTEIGNKRNREVEKMRSERNQLQYEVDILNQRLGQETSHLKDELKGLFDDRKMAVRQEQRTMESKIQELNYKITVTLNSDARSEVEGLRWVLTRRAAMTVGISAFILFMTLRYMSYLNHLQSQAEKKRSQEPKPSSDDGLGEASPTALADQEILGGELLAAKGGVSLG